MPNARPETLAAAAAELDRPSYENLRRALELGRWPDGRALEARQREICVEAVVAWELANLPPEEHSGFVPKGHCGPEEITPVRIIGDE